MHPTDILTYALEHPIICLTVIQFFLAWFRNARGRCPPGPLELPIVGALPFLFRHRADILTGLLEGCRAYNFRTWSVKWLGEKRFCMTTDPKNLEFILKTRFTNFPKGASFSGKLADLLGRGIFATDGPQWKKQRQLFSHVFSESSFKNVIMASFNENGAVLQRLLDEAAATGAECDMQSLFHRFTLDSIGKIAFGLNLGTLENPSAKAASFATAFDAAQGTMESRFFTPGWWLFKPCLRRERELPRHVAILNRFCADLIAARRAAPAPAAEGGGDVLSRALRLRDEDSGALVFGDDDSALRDILLNFLIAGRDTTAQALSWAVLLVARAGRGVAEALAAEGLAAGGGGAGAGAFALPFEGVGKELRYARAVAQETLRLFPSVPKDTKEAVEGCALPDGSWVPAGSLVAYLPYCMGRCPELWGDDAEQFKPERFLPPNPPPSPWKLPAFNGAGPRACLGQNMALVEAAFVLALIYRRFELELSPPEQAAPNGVPFANSLTLPQARGVTMRELESVFRKFAHCTPS